MPVESIRKGVQKAFALPTFQTDNEETTGLTIAFITATSYF